MKTRRTITFVVAAFLTLSALMTWAQDPAVMDSLLYMQELEGVVVKAERVSRSVARVESVEIIGRDQLVRAACCNLGESFTSNPSVDVSYSDAATGARQI